MDYSNFYLLSRDFKREALQVTSGDITDEMSTLCGKYNVDLPLNFTHYMGSRVFDLIETGWTSLFLLSERIFSAFEEHNISGWKKFPAKVHDKSGNLMDGFSLLSVVGKAGIIDNALSEVIWKDPPTPNGNPYQVRKGMYFDLNTWDGSDIFVLQGSLAIIVSQKVKDILEAINSTNVNLTPICEIESDILVDL